MAQIKIHKGQRITLDVQVSSFVPFVLSTFTSETITFEELFSVLAWKNKVNLELKINFHYRYH
jgi:hypothetical protein